MKIQQLPSIPALTLPLPLRSSGDVEAFDANAEKFIQEAYEAVLSLNGNWREAWNGSVSGVNELLLHADVLALLSTRIIDNIRVLGTMPEVLETLAALRDDILVLRGQAAALAALGSHGEDLARLAPAADALVALGTSAGTLALVAVHLDSINTVTAGLNEIIKVSAIAEQVASVSNNLGAVLDAVNAVPALEALGPEYIRKAGEAAADIAACVDELEIIRAAPEHARGAGHSAEEAQAAAKEARDAAGSVSAVTGLPVIAPEAAGKAMVVGVDGARWVLSEHDMNKMAKKARVARLNQLFNLGI